MTDRVIYGVGAVSIILAASVIIMLWYA